MEAVTADHPHAREVSGKTSPSSCRSPGAPICSASRRQSWSRHLASRAAARRRSPLGIPAYSARIRRKKQARPPDEAARPAGPRTAGSAPRRSARGSCPADEARSRRSFTLDDPLVVDSTQSMLASGACAARRLTYSFSARYSHSGRDSRQWPFWPRRSRLPMKSSTGRHNRSAHSETVLL